MNIEELRYQIPDGWLKTLGEMLVDEVNAADASTYVFDAKEKYGSLRIEFINNGDYDTVYRIIDKYSVISQHVCAICGKPDVKITHSGWIYPLCKKCYNKTYSRSQKTYEESVDDDDDGRIPESYRIYEWTEDGRKTTEINISDTVKKVRERWDIEHDTDQ